MKPYLLFHFDFSRMLRLGLLKVFTILTALKHIAAISPMEAGRMTATVHIQSSVDFRPTSPNFNVLSATASLHWFPRNSSHQRASGFKISQSKHKSNEPHLVSLLHNDNEVNAMQIYWEQPGDFAQCQLQATVQTHSDVMPVRHKIPFPVPIDSIPSNVQIYLLPQNIANSSPQINNIASSVTSNTNDLYHAVYNIAEWVHNNIQYKFTSSQKPQSATSVLSSKRGKCDELTALFVSMVRSVGIPARFISGYAYNENMHVFEQRWTGHSWAQVYFPNVGWVPFDVTERQYGYVDAGHVMLCVSLDAYQEDIEYVAHGVDFEPKADDLNVVVEPNGIISKTCRDIDIGLNVQAKEVGFGSAAVVVVTVKNNRDCYISAQLDIVRPREIKALNLDESSRIHMLLNPREVKEYPLFFIMDDKQGYQSGYSYEYPFSISSPSSSATKTASIIVREGGPMFYAKM
jgi:hypothetical protein